MVESRLTRVLLRLGAAFTLAFIYLPLLLIAAYAFNESVTQSWPIQEFTTKTIGIDFGLLTIIVGHATFCIVVVYNNAQARLRRVSGSLEEASADLGADSWQTFRHITFPQMRTALLAGGLLAFALSWDEVVVTIFTAGAQQTLPIWIFANLFRPIEQPVVNVVALFVIVLSIIPVWIAQRVTAERPTQMVGR